MRPGHCTVARIFRTRIINPIHYDNIGFGYGFVPGSRFVIGFLPLSRPEQTVFLAGMEDKPMLSRSFKLVVALLALLAFSGAVFADDHDHDRHGNRDYKHSKHDNRWRDNSSNYRNNSYHHNNNGRWAHNDHDRDDRYRN